MSADPNSSPEILSSRLGLFGRLDEGLYRLETVIIVLALVVMSVTVFTDILYQVVLSYEQAFRRGEAGAAGTLAVLVTFVGGVLFATTAPPEDREIDRPLSIRLGLTAGLLVLVVGGAVSLLYVHSATIYRVLTAAILVAVARLFWEREAYVRFGLLVGAGLLTLWWMGSLPEGYSWAQSYSQVLLLWVGFLGASVASRERRHLKADLMRNVLPPKWVPHFNVVSYLVAGLFTGVLCYLGFMYLFGPDSNYLKPIWEAPAWLPGFVAEAVPTGPLPDDAGLVDRMLNVVFNRYEPGEIPDWLKVMAIPVSAALMVMRFLGHAAAFAVMAWNHETFEEQRVQE